MLWSSGALAVLVGLVAVTTIDADDVPRCNVVVGGKGYYFTFKPKGPHEFVEVGLDGETPSTPVTMKLHNDMYRLYKNGSELPFHFYSNAWDDETKCLKADYRGYQTIDGSEDLIWPKIYTTPIEGLLPPPFTGFIEYKDGKSAKPLGEQWTYTDCFNAAWAEPNSIGLSWHYSTDECSVFVGEISDLKVMRQTNHAVADHHRGQLFKYLPEAGTTGERIFVKDNVGSFDECEPEAQQVNPNWKYLTIDSTKTCYLSLHSQLVVDPSSRRLRRRVVIPGHLQKTGKTLVCRS